MSAASPTGQLNQAKPHGGHPSGTRSAGPSIAGGRHPHAGNPQPPKQGEKQHNGNPT
jgi:hypothetical protein